ncbi:glutamate receptor-like [Hyalella azteca]|uniref:Glutamate receptor-like n=1 Tax=Hyalella azteca TaxID=294128 RepID=A0A979FX45_HYAAZ|nr:glutamate receptor-like [Hyalella azteca]
MRSLATDAAFLLASSGEGLASLEDCAVAAVMRRWTAEQGRQYVPVAVQYENTPGIYSSCTTTMPMSVWGDEEGTSGRHMLDNAAYTREAAYGFYGGLSWLDKKINEQTFFVFVLHGSDNATENLDLWLLDIDGSVRLINVGAWHSSGELRLHQKISNPKIIDFQGRKLILSVVHKPRVFETLYADGKKRKDVTAAEGYIVDLVRIIGVKLNVSLDMIVASSFGVLTSNGTWSGMMGDLVARRASLSPLDFSPSLERQAVVDFSEWLSMDPVILISRSPSLLTVPFLLLQIFSLPSPVCNVAVTLMCFSSSRSQLYSLPLTTAAIAKSFILQETSLLRSLRNASSRVATACFFFVVVSLYAFYQGSIIAFLTVPRSSKPIDSAEDLMARLDEVTPVTRMNTVYSNFILNFPRFSPIAAKVEFMADDFLNTWQFFELIQSGSYCLIDVVSSGVGRAASYETRGQTCRFHESRQILKNDIDMMAHASNSVFRNRIDDIIRQLRSFGLVEHSKKRFFSASCEHSFRTSSNAPLTLKQVQSAFYVWLLGTCLAVLGFLAELTVYRWKNSEH